MNQRVAQLTMEAAEALDGARTLADAERWKTEFLGRSAELPQIRRRLGTLPPDQRANAGRIVNDACNRLERQFAARVAELDSRERVERFERERLDLTLPGRPSHPVGRLHVITQTTRELEDIFAGLGFTILDGPEVEHVELNFDALNHTPLHPARSQRDTFYVSEKVLLRTHTSPVQVRAMRAHKPPLFVIVPGQVYRRDNDATHTPQFHQLEGLAVSEDITLADLKGTLLEFARQAFGGEREVRMRGHFFPFTEPSVEVDVSCFACVQGMVDESTCTLCKGEGWIEILGAGMVDPAVFGWLGDPDYAPDRVQGFAFGLGIERIAMLKHGVGDARAFLENDLRLLEQFG